MYDGLRAFAVALVLGAFVVGCSGGGSVGQDAGDGATGGRPEGAASGAAQASPGDDLGHQAHMQPTRLVVPAAEGSALDRAARIAAGLSENPLGTAIFVDRRPGEGGALAWRDVAGQEPDGHQLAYVTEGLLATDDPGDAAIGPENFEMVARTDSGAAVLVVNKDPEAESFQVQMEDFGDFVEAAKEDPGLVEVADPGPGTVYRAGTLSLEREAGIDLSPKSPGGKAPLGALYDGDVEAALVPADEALTDVWAGELRAIAVLGERRCPDLPNVPTARELGHDVAVPVFGGVAVPAGTPSRVVDELGRAFGDASSSRTFRKALAGTGRVPAREGPGEFAGYVEEQERWLTEAGSRGAR